MKATSFLCLAFVFLGISSCTVGPDYVPPEAPKISQYTGENGKTFSSSLPTEWWTTFESPKLNQLIQLGIKNNHSLIAMQETLKQAQENVTATTGQLYPQANLSAGAGYEKYGVQATGSPDTIPAFHYYSLGPSINWALDIFGANKRSTEQRQALMQYQQEKVNATFLTLTGNIVTTAMKLAEFNAQIKYLQDIIHDDHEHLRLADKGIEVGSLTQKNKLIIENQLSNDEALLAPLQQQLNAAQGEINILIGKFPADWQPPQFELSDFVLPETLPLTLPSKLAHDRPDILAAESLLHAASANVGIATANLYPQINLSASLTQQALSPGQLFNPSSTAASVLGGITAPIFSGGTLRAQKRAAEHAYEATYANYQDVVVRAFVQVSTVLHALQYDKQTVSAQKKALISAKASLTLTQLGNKLGSATALEIINAERLYAEAQISYDKAIAQQYRDTAQLYLVLGGGTVS